MLRKTRNQFISCASRTTREPKTLESKKSERYYPGPRLSSLATVPFCHIPFPDSVGTPSA